MGKIIKRGIEYSGGGGGAVDAYTKAETDALLDEKSSFDVATISTAGGGTEVHATLTQGTDEASLNYYKTDTLPNVLNLNVDDDSFRIPTTDYVDGKSGVFVAVYEQTTYADVKDAIDAHKAIVLDMPANNNQFCITFSTYTNGGNVLMYAIYKISDKPTLITVTLTPQNQWSTSLTDLQEKLTAGDGITIENNTISADAGTHLEVGVEKWYGTYNEDGVTYQVYSKIIKIDALPSTAGITNYPHGITGIKQILQAYGFTGDGFVLNAPRQTTSDNISIYQVQKSGNIAIEVGKDRSSKSAYVCLIYAKNN